MAERMTWQSMCERDISVLPCVDLHAASTTVSLQAEEGSDIKGSKVPSSSQPSSAYPAAASAGPAHKGKHARGSKAPSRAAAPSRHHIL